MVNGAELADVLEVGPNTTPSAAKSQLDRLKQAYGLLYSNSAQRSKNRCVPVACKLWIDQVENPHNGPSAIPVLQNYW